MSESAAAEVQQDAPDGGADMTSTGSTDAKTTDQRADMTGDQGGGDSQEVKDWRAEITGGVEDKTLNRFNSPKDLYKSYQALQKKMSSGEYVSKLPDNPSEDDIKAYRESLGIPESHDKYEYTLPEGFNFGEADKPYVDLFLKDLHNSNATPAQVNAALNSYAKIQQEAAMAYVERDKADHQNFEDTMRNTWGNEYRANMNMVKNFIENAPEKVRGMIANGRGPDGTALLNDPEFVEWIASINREINPAATILQTSGKDSLESVKGEIAKLEELMKSDIKAWHKNKEAKEKHRKLLAIQEKIESRS